MKYELSNDFESEKFSLATLGDLRQKKYIMWFILKKLCNKRLSSYAYKVAKAHYELAKTIKPYSTNPNKKLGIRIQTELLSMVNELLKHASGGSYV